MRTRVKRPARLSLQAPSKVRLDGKKFNKPKRREYEGPFAGMNLRNANIREPPKKASKPLIRKTNEDPRITGRSKRKVSQKGERQFKALKMQRPLATVSYQQRSIVKNKIQEIDSFDVFPLLDVVLKSIYTQALGGLKDIKPTPVQRIAIPALLTKSAKSTLTTSPGFQTYLIAAETGSGKTLSYIVPTINAIKLAESNDTEAKEFDKKAQEEKNRQDKRLLFSPPLTNLTHPTTGRPRAIILVPSHELVVQVGAVIKLFGHTVKFRSALISSAFSRKVIRNRLFTTTGIDIVISTPHLMASIADEHPNILSRVTHLIVDEADSLLDRDFAPLTSKIIDKASPSLQQLIFCSATIPLALDRFLRSRFPDTKRLVTPNLHAIPRRVQLEVVNVEGTPYQGNKDLACADTIWSIGKMDSEHNKTQEDCMSVKHVLVFVNQREKTLELRDFLFSKGIDAIAFNRDTPDERKSEILSSLTKHKVNNTPNANHEPLFDYQPSPIPEEVRISKTRKKLENVQTIVTTDLASRGIDTFAVKNVILYDVPHSTIDFIHRLGRMGRMGRRGRGYVLVDKDDRKDIVAEVKEGMFLGKSLI